MKITSIQKKIIGSTLGFILSIRALRYTFSRQIGEIVKIGSYSDMSSILYIGLFCIEWIILIASVVGFISIIRSIFDANKKLIIRERFFGLLLSSFWTLIISIILALIIKILIWP